MRYSKTLTNVRNIIFVILLHTNVVLVALYNKVRKLILLSITITSYAKNKVFTRFTQSQLDSIRITFLVNDVIHILVKYLVNCKESM